MVATIYSLLVLVLLLLARVLTAPANFNSLGEDYYAEDGTAATRAERSANISHILGSSRKIQLVVNKYWHLQLLPDGTVNGTDTDIDNDFTILQRSSLSPTQITIQGLATCKYLCMDHCGLLYASREYSDECIFNEMIEAHNFNTYSSVKYSNEKRSMYLALNKKGIPRKVQTKPRMLGKLAVFANVLTKPVPKHRAESLVGHMLKRMRFPIPKQHHLRHHGFHQFCANMRTVPEKLTKCRKKKKRKGKCNDDDSCEGKMRFSEKKKCEDGEEEEECLRRLHMIRRKRKSRVGKVDGVPAPVVAEVDNSNTEEELTKRKRLHQKRDKKCSKDCTKEAQLSMNVIIPVTTTIINNINEESTDWTTSSAMTN